jgi:hypothetical protein
MLRIEGKPALNAAGTPEMIASTRSFVAMLVG